jgi:hypothetical protein
MNKEMGFTLAKYKIKTGNEDEFVKTWNDLAALFSSLPKPPIWGTLIRSLSDRSTFFSFGPWHKPQDVQEMRNNPKVMLLFQKIQGLCTELSPGDYEIVEHRIVNQ